MQPMSRAARDAVAAAAAARVGSGSCSSSSSTSTNSGSSSADSGSADGEALRESLAVARAMYLGAALDDAVALWSVPRGDVADAALAAGGGVAAADVAS